MNDEEGETVQFFPRRAIYYKRLVGDNLFGTQKAVVTTKKSPWSVAIFLVYFLIAYFVIVSHAKVQTQFAVNNAVKEAILRTPYSSASQTTSRSTFDDVRHRDEALLWLTRSVLPHLYTGTSCGDLKANGYHGGEDTRGSGCPSRALPLSLGSFNRVLPKAGLGGADPDLEHAHVRLTLRKIKVQNPTEPVTQRFKAFVNAAWTAFNIGGEDPDIGFDETSSYTGEAPYDNLPPGLKDVTKGNATMEIGEPMTVQWDRCERCGYKQHGGYVIDLLLRPAESGERLTMSEAVNEVLSQEAQLSRNDGEPQVLSWRGVQALTPKFFDSELSFLAIEFLTYNANYQTLTVVKACFTWNAGGDLHDKKVRADTILLNLGATIDGVSIDFIWYVFLAFTIKDVLGWCWGFYKDGASITLRNPWTTFDAFSMLCSIMCVVLWTEYSDLKSETNVRNWALDDYTIDNVSRRFEEFWLFQAMSSFSLLTISIRIIKHFGASVSRVKLLMYTISSATKYFFLFILYIIVFFIGFMQFANINFAFLSPKFKSTGGTIYALVDIFFGKVDPIDSVPNVTWTKNVFFVLYTLFFFFITIQMFNSVINYAYNFSCMEMEPMFERERQELKARQLHQASRVSCWKSIKSYILKAGGRTGTKETRKKVTEGYDLDSITKPEVRDKVEEWQKKEKEKKKGEGYVDGCIFTVYLCAYVGFLVVNLAVPVQYDLKTNLENAFDSAMARVVRADGAVEPLSPFGDTPLQTMDEMSDWIAELPRNLFLPASGRTAGEAVNTRVVVDPVWEVEGLPQGWKEGDDVTQVFSQFDRTSTRAITMLYERLLHEQELSGSIAEELTKNSGRWHNPLGQPPGPPYSLEFDAEDSGRIYWGRTHDDGSRESARIRKTQTYGGLIVPPDSYCFSGWNCVVQKSAGNAQAIMRVTTRKLKLQPNPDPELKEVVPYVLDTKVIEFSADDVTGEWPYDQQLLNMGCEWGSMKYKGGSGYSCLLLADPDYINRDFPAQWADRALTLETKSIAFDMMTYNANAYMIVYTTLEIQFSASGTISLGLQMTALKHEISAFGLACFGIYAFLVFYYLYVVGKELSAAYSKKSISLGAPTFLEIAVPVLWEWLHDLYHILDTLSIGLSGLSIFLFYNYYNQLLKFNTLVEDETKDYAAFLSSFEGIAADMSTYQWMSSVNVIVIFMRLGKLLRESDRMNKIFQTISLAMEDLLYFVVILMIVLWGYACFGHISFGAQMSDFGATFDVYLRKCLDIIIGDFDGMEIIDADPVLGPLFFFSFLLAFNCMFVNIFFAIIDRFFIYAKPPPINWQKKLKPVLGNLVCFKCIEWDHDLEMEKTVHNPLAKTGPPERAQSAKRAMNKIDEIREKYKDDDDAGSYDCKIVTDHEVIGQPDDKLHEVVTWARDEARRYLELLRGFSDEKVTFANEAAFINIKKKELKKNLQDDKEKMLDAERQLKYAVQFHEKSAQANLDTVCKAMLLLEHKIGRKMSLKHKLKMELDFLKDELGRLQYTNEELQHDKKEQDEAPNDEEQLSADGDAPSVLIEVAENKKEDLAIEEGGPVEDVDNAAPAMGNTQTSMAKRTRQELIEKVPTAQY